MPLMRVSVTPGTFDDAGREKFVAALTEAAWRAESIPDDPLARARAVVLWDDLSPGQVWWGGRTADDLISAVFVTLSVSDGVLDPVRRERFAADLHAAAAATLAGGDERILHTQVVYDEVPEGRWGRDGAVLRLPQIAQQAGFLHLQDIAAP